MQHYAEMMAALSDPTRLGALHLLWSGQEQCVCKLMDTLEASQSRMSRHMGILRQVGLVIARREAQWVYYRRNPALTPEKTAIIDALMAALAQTVEPAGRAA